MFLNSFGTLQHSLLHVIHLADYSTILVAAQAKLLSPYITVFDLGTN